MATSSYPSLSSLSPLNQVMAHSALKMSEAAGLLVPPIYIAASLIRRRGMGFSIRGLMRASTRGVVIGAPFGAAAAWGMLRNEPLVALEDRCFRLVRDNSRCPAPYCAITRYPSPGCGRARWQIPASQGSGMPVLHANAYPLHDHAKATGPLGQPGPGRRLRPYRRRPRSRHHTRHPSPSCTLCSPSSGRRKYRYGRRDSDAHCQDGGWGRKGEAGGHGTYHPVSSSAMSIVVFRLIVGGKLICRLGRYLLWAVTSSQFFWARRGGECGGHV